MKMVAVMIFEREQKRLDAFQQHFLKNGRLNAVTYNMKHFLFVTDIWKEKFIFLVVSYTYLCSHRETTTCFNDDNNNNNDNVLLVLGSVYGKE